MTEQAYYCPECGRRYYVDLGQFAGRTLVIICGSCEAVFEPSVRAVPGNGSAYPAGAPSVLVAHESPSVCSTVGRVVRDAGYVPRYVHTGTDAVAAFDSSLLEQPAALVLDVGVPEMLAFDVVAALRRRSELGSLPIVLLASVFDPTRYKRRPSSLHGANDYLELHHVPDRLPGLLMEYFGGEEARTEHRGHLPGESARAEAIRMGGIDGSDRARIEARRIVSDIALYNEKEILAGLQAGDLETRLAEVLGEGRRLYQQLTEDLRGVRGDPYSEAVVEMMQSIRRRSEM